MFLRRIIRFFSGGELTNTVDQGRPLFEQIAKATGYDGTQRVLDYGCGTGGIGFHFLKTGGNYTGVDISGSALKVARQVLNRCDKTYELRQISKSGDLGDFQDFDIVIAQSVFTHCPIRLFEEFLSNVPINAKSKVLCNFAVGENSFNISNIDFVVTIDEITHASTGFEMSEVQEWSHPSDRLTRPYLDRCFLFTL